MNTNSDLESDLFAHKAKDYDSASRRVANVQAIVETMKNCVKLDEHVHLMDFGAGTGLLLAGIAPYVGKITAVDVSASMIAELSGKQADIPCQLDIIKADLTVDDRVFSEDFHGFDGIISSMTLHHIADIPKIFSIFHQLLKQGGFIALADLDLEDGSFHSQGKDTGVFHYGFDREYIGKIAKESGFDSVNIVTANEIEKNDKQYGVFLLTAEKSEAGK